MMMGTLSIVMLIADYVITANNVYINLDEFYDNFVIEAHIINEAKCLVANDMLEDFYIDEGLVSVYEDGSDYILSFYDIDIGIKVEDKMIIYYEIR